ncbi:MAG: hypothetical protein AAF628_14310 [Planctomycetota bacterium]
MNRSSRVLLVGGAFLAAAGVVWATVRGPRPQPSAAIEAAPTPEADQSATAQLQGSAPANEPQLPPEFYQKLPPNSRVAMTLPGGFTSGIRCPDGSFLPLLNGVPYAPQINRDPRWGPVPPVVAKRTDSGGYEWYEHADGSITTVRWTPTTFMGEERMEPVTSHDVPLDPSFGQPPVDAAPAEPPAVEPLEGEGR